ncbi:hypothetical protein ACS5PN_18995 [Roseateles sp. NT4]|uniref:hypothetical protein n=1 Tax=Roseateles sp. NT4 TaxID=3453715 RepID=UPI003EEF4D60
MRTSVQLATAAVVAIAAFAAYCSLAERSAERKAREFCGALQVGMAVEPLELQAIRAGASQRQTQWIKLPREDAVLTVTFTGAFPLSRHICNVHGSPTLARSEYVYLD